VQVDESSAEGYKVAQWTGASNIDAETEGIPSLFRLEKRRLRGESNCCPPGRGRREKT